jgi:hypothetical protein
LPPRNEHVLLCFSNGAGGGMTPITYTSEQPQDWAEALWRASTLSHLRDVCAAWEKLCPDAKAVVDGMKTREDFRQWRKGLAKERKGEFAGEEFAVRFGALLLPELLLKVGMAAARFNAPWGCTYIRMKEAGQLPKVAQ